MKKIMVLDYAADSGGAETVLKQFYNSLTSDVNCEAWFVTSVIDLPESNQSHLIKIPWVKRSWFHRLFCDIYYMPKLVKKINPDELLSLQNKAINSNGIKQSVFVQNCIFFSDYTFNVFNDTRLWIYKNIIGRIVKSSFKEAEEIIVQSNWMKELISQKCNFDKTKIKVLEKSRPQQKVFGNYKQKRTNWFFYPASPFSYKNHRIIIDACKILLSRGINDCIFYFTFDKNDNNTSKKIAKEIQKYNLPIKLMGKLNNEEMNDMYMNCNLIYPSLLETVGLPLLEAQSFNCFIIAADKEYARETVGDYNNVCFFDPYNPEKLSEQIELFKNNKNI